MYTASRPRLAALLDAARRSGQHEASLLLMRHRFDMALGGELGQVWQDHAARW
jgi:hypothetical protein